jgi:hypothetical protein
VFPQQFLFWRSSAATFCKHRNPLFAPGTLITIESLCVDEMHTLHLGVFGNYVVHVLWELILADAWGVGGSLPQDAAFARSALAIRYDLFQWYKQQKRDNPQKPIYELNDFDIHILGSKDSRVLKAKAAETGTLLSFAVHLAKTYRTKLVRADAVVGAGLALEKYLEITRHSSGQLSASQRQGLADACLRFLVLRGPAGIPFKPKMHLYMHLVQQSRRFGNPKDVGTWHDEGLNRALAAVAGAAHAAVWHKRILATFNHEAGPTASQAKKQRKW